MKTLLIKTRLLKTAVSIAVTSVLFSGSVISTQAFAEDMIINDIAADNTTSYDETTENYMAPGMGIGAATGTLVAGPVGFVVGGLVGALFGSSQGMSQEESGEIEHQESTDTVVQTAEDNNIDTATGTTHESDTQVAKTQESLYLVQLGAIDSVVDNDIASNTNTQQEKIMNILVSDLSLDVYFRSGSTDIEKFYPARLGAIADLVNSMDNLELHLDGYTDRRGDKNQNIALANERIDKVREQLIDAGVDEGRIKSKAFGEAKMKSAAGNLEAYTFDRRVVIRFERLARNISDVASISQSAPEDESLNTVTVNNTPVVADATSRF